MAERVRVQNQALPPTEHKLDNADKEGCRLETKLLCKADREA